MMAMDLKFEQIVAVALAVPAGSRPAGAPEVLQLFGLANGVVYRYLTGQESKVDGGGWKKMSMQPLEG